MRRGRGWRPDPDWGGPTGPSGTNWGDAKGKGVAPRLQLGRSHWTERDQVGRGEGEGGGAPTPTGAAQWAERDRSQVGRPSGLSGAKWGGAKGQEHELALLTANPNCAT